VAEVKVVDEPVTVVASLKGWVRALKGHEVDVGGLSFKAGDGLYGTFACRSVDTLLVFGSNGRVYSVAVSTLPGGRGDGVPITTLIDLEAGTQIAHYWAGAADQVLLLANTGGFGLLAKAGDLHGRNKAGKAFLTLETADRPLPPVAVAPAHTQVACLARRRPAADLRDRRAEAAVRRWPGPDADGRVTPRCRWCRWPASPMRCVCSGTGRGGKPKDELLKGVALAAHAGKRARKGRKLDAIKPTRVLAP
jgi:topoisomerase-4 subunit A